MMSRMYQINNQMNHHQTTDGQGRHRIMNVIIIFTRQYYTEAQVVVASRRCWANNKPVRLPPLFLSLLFVSFTFTIVQCHYIVTSFNPPSE